MPHKAREGDLYRTIELHGKTFHIYYGYYDERERSSRWSEPIPIYPSFKNAPQYTNEGYAFVTGIQDVCERFIGRSTENGCHGCRYYEEGEDLIGVCKCEQNKKKQ